MFSVLHFWSHLCIKIGVSFHEYLLVLNSVFLIIHNRKIGVRLCFLLKFCYRQAKKSVLVLVLFCVSKMILFPCNLLVTICLRIIHCCNQSMYLVANTLKNVLSLLDLWYHFVNQNRREVVLALDCYRCRVSDSKRVYLATTTNRARG